MFYQNMYVVDFLLKKYLVLNKNLSKHLQLFNSFIEMEAVIAEMEQITFNMNKGLQEQNKENLKPVSNTTLETVDNQNVMENETQVRIS